MNNEIRANRSNINKIFEIEKMSRYRSKLALLYYRCEKFYDGVRKDKMIFYRINLIVLDYIPFYYEEHLLSE